MNSRLSSGDDDVAGRTQAPLRFSLGTWISLLVLGLFIPFSLLTAFATRQAVQSTRELAQIRLSDLSRALAVAIDQQMKAQIAALDVMALAPALSGQPDQWRVDTVDHYARAVARLSGAAVAIFRPDGQQIVNTLMPFGAPLPRTALAEMVREVVARKSPAVSELARSTVTGRLGFGIGVPVLRNGEAVAVVAILSHVGLLHDTLAAQNLPEGIFASLVDGAAVVVARSDSRHTDFAGRKIVEENARKLATGVSGRYSGYALEGITREFAFTKLTIAQGWSLVVAQTADDLNADAERYATQLAIFSVFVVAIGGGLALAITQLIVTPIAALDRYAATLGHAAHQTEQPLPSAVVTQVARLQDSVLAAERRLRSNERRWRELLTLLDLGLFISRQLDGTILYWSRGAAEFYGWSRSEATGEKSHALLATVFPVDLVEIEETLYMTGQWSGSLVHTARDGRRVDMIAQMVMATTDDGATHVLEILHDVTELHRAERALRLALETGEIGTFFIDLQDGEVTLDERGQTMLGARHSRLSRGDFLALIPAAQRAIFDEALARCIGPRGDGLLDVEIDTSVGASAKRCLSLRGQAEFLSERPVSVAGVMMDVTRLRQDSFKRANRLIGER